MPVIIQGLGARSKVDAPTAGWDNAKRFVDEATARGAAVYSMAMSKPFNRTFDLAAGTKLYEGALQFNRIFTEAATVDERIALIADPAFRDDDPRLGRQPEPRPRRRAHAAAAALGGAARQQGVQAGEREARRPLARRHRRRAGRAPHRRHARHRRCPRTSPSSSCGRPRRPSGSRARRSPRTTRT